MPEITTLDPSLLGVELPPTEDELPCDDGMPMETQRHVLQMLLLIESLSVFWAERQDVFIGGNMFVYFSLEQVRNQDFRGPDFFVVLDVPRRERKSWVVWQEGKGPDVVIELLSESTAEADRGEKKRVFHDRLRVPEYFWFDPFSGELAGFSLRNGVYEPIEADARGRLVSQKLGLALARLEGTYSLVETSWLRLATLEGEVLPTSQEIARVASERAGQERERAERLAERLREAGIDPDAL
jgi:Uma2 family endonuclease